MGLILRFFPRPCPLGRAIDIADDRLATLSNVHVLDCHLLLAHLSGEGASELIEGPFGAVLLRDALDVREAAGERHRRHVDGGHLRGKRARMSFPFSPPSRS